MTIMGDAEQIDDFAQFGIRAFTTTRHSGTFSLASDEQVRVVMQRWQQLRIWRQPKPGLRRRLWHDDDECRLQ